MKKESALRKTKAVDDSAFKKTKVLEKSSAKSPELRDNIKDLMAANQWNALELSRKSGQKSSDIYNILYGKSKKPSADKVEALAVAFGVSVSALLHGKNARPEYSFQPASDWDGILYTEAMNVVRKVLAKENIKFNSREDEKKRIMNYTMRVYNYARKRQESFADPIFASDIIDQD